MNPSQACSRLLSEDGTSIEVVWEDGHVSLFPFRYLRGYCPCAACQGHGGGPLSWQAPGEIELKGVRLVGHYGINPVWSDGHDSGIFADSVLRRMCPCSTCLDWAEDGEQLTLLEQPAGCDESS